jgi:hypothetical protein
MNENNALLSIAEVSKLIQSGEPLVLAGDEKALSQLPAGNWIGGTIPYFMGQEGGEFSQDKVFITKLPSYLSGYKIRTYDSKSIENIYADLGNNSTGLVIIPATTDVHLSFALKAPQYKNFAYAPLLGWISGVFLDELGQNSPKVYASQNGKTEVYEDRGVVLEMELPENKVATLEIVNIFETGTGDTIEFPEDSFSAKEAIINGEKRNFADYVKSNNIDIKLPLVTDYCGAMINISFQAVEDEEVKFYAPVFKGIKYHHAKPVQDYVRLFEGAMPSENTNITFSCNCILNYLYSELEGKKTGKITGPITFGEVCYQLLNQTLAYLTISDR